MTHEALEIAENARAAANVCAAWILDELQRVLAAAPVARIAISGGATPKLMFETLAKTPFAWNNVHVFWVDERCVPPSDSRSNYRLANETWLEPARVPKENIHRIKGELDPSQAAEDYVGDVRRSFRLGDG
ncbi:MAG TPA: 6-phosphogluconolactonase, partial [Bryobacteraceae bacterium]|nr:6-phosphogluconolactonase [Bryobacteraceae bacterium]